MRKKIKFDCVCFFDVFLFWLKKIKTLFALEKNLVLNLRDRKMNQKSYTHNNTEEDLKTKLSFLFSLFKLI